MKTKQQIEKELKKYDLLDHPKVWQKKGLFQGFMPLTEWVLQQDKGFRKALRWVLELDK